MRANLKSRWFPSMEEEEALLEKERLELQTRTTQMVRWIEDPQFTVLLEYVESQIIKNEPTEDTLNPLFKNGVVKGLRIVQANLKSLRAKVQEIVNG